MVIGFDRLVVFCTQIKSFFGTPCLVHAIQAPLEASSRRSDRLIANRDKDGVGVRAGQNSDGVPTAARDLHLEVDVGPFSIRGDSFRGHREAVLNQFHRDLSRAFDSCPFDVPIGLLSEFSMFDFWLGLFIEPSSDAKVNLNFARLIEPQLTTIQSHLSLINSEIKQMTPTITHVVATGANPFAPSLIF